MHRCIAFRRRLRWPWKEGSPEPAVDEMRVASHRLDLKKSGDLDIGTSGHRVIGNNREREQRKAAMRLASDDPMTRSPDDPIFQGRDFRKPTAECGVRVARQGCRL